MSKYRYTVVSDEYVGSLRNLRKTGRVIQRPAQILFNPQFRFFNLTQEVANKLARVPPGFPVIDNHGDQWERLE